MSLYFQNPGEAEIAALLTMGVNVKTKENAIGFFGTGFTYAVGGILRIGGTIHLHIGLTHYEFVSRNETIRGQNFEVVHILNHTDGSEQRLSITTDMGKTWDPWMFYRELRCNAQDENGAVDNIPKSPQAGTTLIAVTSPEVEMAHFNSHLYFVNGEPLLELDGVEVHASVDKATSLFYRGIRVGGLTSVPLFAYNITAPMMLTEDRTVRSGHLAENAIITGICSTTDRDFARQVLTAPADMFEGKLDFSAVYKASEVFLDVATEIIKARPLQYNMTLRKMLSRLRNADPYDWVDPNVSEAKTLSTAEGLLRMLGHDTREVSIRIVDNLGYGVDSAHSGNNIYVARRTLMRGERVVAMAILKQYLGSRYGYASQSEEMENYLLEHLFTTQAALNESIRREAAGK